MATKPTTRPTQFQRCPRQTESSSSVRLTLPMLSLAMAYVAAFVTRAVRRSLLSPPAADIDNILIRHRLQLDCIDLDVHFFHLQPRPIEPATQRMQLERLATRADDYADENGSWRLADDFQAAAQSAYGEWYCGILAAIAEAQSAGGSQASRAILRRLESSLTFLRTKSTTESWSADRSRQLREMAAELRGLARPRGWRRLALWLCPWLPCRWWLEARQLTKIESANVTVNAAARLRFKSLALAAQQQLLAQLLGNATSSGLLPQLERDLPEAEPLLAAVNSAIPKRSRAIPAGPFELLLIASIEDVIDERGTTLEKFLDEITARFSISPGRLADYWWQNGLEVDGRAIGPGNWHQCAPSELANSVIRDVRRALGISDVKAKANLDDPKTAYDVFTTIGLTHTRFRHVLRQRVRDWVRHARPYLVAPQISGSQPLGNWYLSCEPADRSTWLKMLAPHGCLPRPANTDFDVPHSAMAVLTRHIYGIAAQAHPSFYRGVSLRASRQARGERVLPVENRAGEMRTLHERPDDHEDTVAVWQALRRCKAVRALSGEIVHWTPASVEPSLQHHFYDCRLTPLPQTARRFQSMLRDPAFLSFVEVYYSLGDSWSERAMRLAGAPHPETAAKALVALGVLTPVANQAYVMAGEPPATRRGVVDGLYRWQFGELKGLTEEKFLEALRDHDWLYGAMFFRVLDAWTAGELTDADATPFMHWFRATYLT